MRKHTFLACLIVAAAFASPSQAQDAAPAVEPRAMALLDAMSRRLAEAKTLSFNARIVNDVPTADKTPIFLTTVADVSFRRPAHLRVITSGDGAASVFVADGANMARADTTAGTIAAKAAPQGIDALIRSAGEHGLDLPFADVLLDKPFGDLSKGITSAFVIGQSRLVGGTRTNMVSVSGANGHMQLWIGAEDNLPRQVVVTESRSGITTHNMVTYTNWAVSRPLNDNVFSSATYNKLRKVEMKPVQPVD